MVKGDVPAKEEMPASLSTYIETNTYLLSSDPNFFAKLKQVLPHNESRCKVSSQSELLPKNNAQELQTLQPKPTLVESQTDTNICFENETHCLL